MVRKGISRTIATHDGRFHADEVTACALLVLFDLADPDKIVRTRDPKKLLECEFICDVGGIYNPNEKFFDHHQADYQGPMSSAGMVLKYLHSTAILTEREYQFFHETLIAGVDAEDNGHEVPGFCTFSTVVTNYAPIYRDVNPFVYDKSFREALDFVVGHLQRMRERYNYTSSCRVIVEKVMAESENYMIFDDNIPWLENFFELGGKDHKALFVVMPAGEHWKLRGVPPSDADKMGVRLYLPEAWAGLLDDDLKVQSGIKGAIFCHKGRFISVWETKEDALAALNYVLKEHKLKGG